MSESAGLSVLAATEAPLKPSIAGLIGLGLPNLNELGWRSKDMLIHLTHHTPDGPTFSVAGTIDRVAPVAVGVIHSTRDEAVPVSEIQQVMAQAQEPKKLWIVKAADHRCSDNLAEFDKCLLEAISWITGHSAK